MKKQSLKIFLCFGFCILSTSAFAQERNDALPQIPNQQTVPNVMQPGQGMPNIDPNSQRAMVNPIDVIKQKESQNTSSGFWRASNPNPEAPPEEKEKTAKEQAIENVELQQKLQQNLKDAKSEENITAAEKTSSEDFPPASDDKEAKNTESVKTDKKDDEAETAKTETDTSSADEDKVVGNNSDNQANGKKDDDALSKKEKRDEAVKKVITAKKSIPLVEPPKRTWRID